MSIRISIFCQEGIGLPFLRWKNKEGDEREELVKLLKKEEERERKEEKEE